MLMPGKERNKQDIPLFPVKLPAVNTCTPLTFQNDHRRLTQLAMHGSRAAGTDFRESPGDNLAAEIIPTGTEAFIALEGFKLDLAHLDCMLLVVEILSQNVLQATRAIQRATVRTYLDTYLPHVSFSLLFAICHS